MYDWAEPSPTNLRSMLVALSRASMNVKQQRRRRRQRRAHPMGRVEQNRGRQVEISWLVWSMRAASDGEEMVATVTMARIAKEDRIAMRRSGGAGVPTESRRG